MGNPTTRAVARQIHYSNYKQSRVKIYAIPGTGRTVMHHSLLTSLTARAAVLPHQMSDPIERAIAAIAKSASLRTAWIGVHYGGDQIGIDAFVAKIDALVERRSLHRAPDQLNVDRYSATVPPAQKVRAAVEAIKRATQGEWRSIPEIASATGQKEAALRRCAPILVAAGLLEETAGQQPHRMRWNAEVEEVLTNLDAWIGPLARTREQIERAQAEHDALSLCDTTDLL